MGIKQDKINIKTSIFVSFLSLVLLALKRAVLMCIFGGYLLAACVFLEVIYLLLVYWVTALVPSLTACLASSPGRRRRTAVWISRDEMVDFLL